LTRLLKSGFNTSLTDFRISQWSVVVDSSLLGCYAVVTGWVDPDIFKDPGAFILWRSSGPRSIHCHIPEN